MALTHLRHPHARTPQELAARASMDRGTITRLISGREKRDVAVRIPNHAEARSGLICLTPRGTNRLKALVRGARTTG